MVEAVLARLTEKGSIGQWALDSGRDPLYAVHDFPCIVFAFYQIRVVLFLPIA